MYVVQVKLWHLTPDDVQPCVLPKSGYNIVTPDVVLPCMMSKGIDGMQHPTSSYTVYVPQRK